LDATCLKDGMSQDQINSCPWVGLGWVGNASEILVFSGLGRRPDMANPLTIQVVYYVT